MWLVFQIAPKQQTLDVLFDSWVRKSPFEAMHRHDGKASNDLSPGDRLLRVLQCNVLPEKTIQKFSQCRNCVQKNAVGEPGRPTVTAATFVLIRTQAVTTGPFSFLQRYEFAETIIISAIYFGK